MLCKRTSWTSTALSTGLKKIIHLFVFKSVKSYRDFLLSANFVGKVNWERFLAFATSAGRPFTQCENPSLMWLERLSLNQRSHSPASSIYTESMKEILTTVTGWPFDGDAKMQEAQWQLLCRLPKLAANTFSFGLQLPCYFNIQFIF